MANRYSLSYVISARKFCVYDKVMDKRTNGSDGVQGAQTMVDVLNVAEDRWEEREETDDET